MRNLLLIFIAGIFCLNAAFAQVEAVNDPLKSQPIKVGVIISLSGPIAWVGESIKNGIILADQKFDLENKFEFIFEDDGFQPKNSLSAALKLIRLNQVSALVVFGSSTSLAVADIAEQNRVPMISLSTLNKVSDNKSFVVRHYVSTDVLNKATLAEVAKRKYQSVALVTTQQDAMLSLRDLFVAAKPMPILVNEEFVPGDIDFRGVVAKIKSTNPSATYIIMLPPQVSVFSKQLRETGYKGEIFCALPAGHRNEIAAASGALEGAWIATGDDRAAANFYAEFEKKFSEHPMTETASAHDIAKLIIEGQRSGDLNAYLHNVRDFQGALGTYSADGHNAFTIPPLIKIISGLELKPL